MLQMVVARVFRLVLPNVFPFGAVSNRVYAVSGVLVYGVLRGPHALV